MDRTNINEELIPENIAANKVIGNETTQATLKETSDILKEVLRNLEEVDFRILKHPNREEIQKQLEKYKETNKNSSSDQEENANSGFYANLQSLLEDITVKERDYKVLATEQIVKKAKTMSYPMAYRNEAIYIYNGKFWDIFHPNDFSKFLEYCYLRLGVPLTMSKDATFLKKGLDQFERAAHLKENIDTGIYLNFLNGTMEFDCNGEYTFREHRPEDFINYVLPFEFNPGAEAPKFQQYLDEVVPETDKQHVLAEFIGSVFSPLKHEKVLILYGSGHNGKSVFMDVVTALLGSQNICSHTLESLTDKKLYHVGDLERCLLNYSGEISTKANPDMFKKLASGEKVTARYPYGRPFEIENYARLAFNCNKLPEVQENTEGFFRRFKIVPFDVRIKESKKDPKLAKKIISEELPGIMNWVLKGLKRLEKNKKLSKCARGEQVLKEYRRESDTVGQFLEDYQSSFTEPVQSSELYEKYDRYCQKCGFSKLGLKNFAQELDSKGVSKYRKASGIFYNVHELPSEGT